MCSVLSIIAYITRWVFFTWFVPLFVSRPEKMTVVLGAHNIGKKEKTQQWIQVAEYIPNPNYTRGYHYDIMLLKVNKS